MPRQCPLWVKSGHRAASLDHLIGRSAPVELATGVKYKDRTTKGDGVPQNRSIELMTPTA
jgi:hypothetical protein